MSAKCPIADIRRRPACKCQAEARTTPDARTFWQSEEQPAPIKSVVQAEASARGCSGVLPNTLAACDINSDLTISEIDIEIFKLGTPIARKGEFNTCAGCPTGLDVFKVRGCKRNAAQSKIVVGLDFDRCAWPQVILRCFETPCPCALWVIRRHGGRPRHVRFTPKSGHQASGMQCPLSATSRHRAASFDYLVGAQQERIRNCEPNGLCSSYVDRQLKFGRLFYRQL